MLIHATSSPATDDVDREIRGGFRTLLFAPGLERRYEDETRAERQRYFIATGQIATVLYDLFLFSDWQMTPDVFKAALIVRLGIFTPMFGLLWLLFTYSPSKTVREGLSSGLAIISVAMVMYVLTISRSPDLVIYQHGTLLIMLFTAVIQRLRFRFAAVTLVSILVIQIVAATQLHGITPRLMATVTITFVTALVLLLWAAYALEKEQRRSFLLDLRSRILNDHLDQLAKHDALTGLWNRHHLDTVMTSAWTDAQTHPRRMAVILLDIDHFKSLNDCAGHLEGDKCLSRIAASVHGAVADDDKAAVVRFGGEEFLVFIDGADLGMAIKAAERIQIAIRQTAIPHPAFGDGAIVTASFGVAAGPAPDLSMERLVAAADDNLYASKRAGRDRIWPISASDTDPGLRCLDLRVA